MTIQTYLSLLAFVFGALVGSFLNVCIYRIPAGESIVSPPSHCPGCGNRIRPWDNIPVVSYLLLRGKCRHCGSGIALRYPLVELAMALLSLGLFRSYGPTPAFLVCFLLTAALLVLTFIDLDHYILPNVITLPGIVVGLVCSSLLTGVGWRNALLGIVAGGGSLLLVIGVYYLLTRREGMGMGDVKLLAMSGAFLGWRAIPFIVLVGSLAGSVIGLAIMARQRSGLTTRIPFGPYLALGTLLYLFWGERLTLWYLGLFH